VEVIMSHPETKPTTGFALQVSEDDPDVAYLRLPSHPGSFPGKTLKSVRLVDVLGPYTGPDILFDFDLQGVLVGIEIVG
jgi:Protein of unknown function (DUF2283)